MLRIHTDEIVRELPKGHWFWSDENEKLVFNPLEDDTKNLNKTDYIISGGYKFRADMNQLEEMIFRQKFMHEENPFIPVSTITYLDLKDLVLFLAPSEFVRKDFLQFLNTIAVSDLIQTSFLYFDLYLKLVEFILIRRDQVSGRCGEMESDDSVQEKRLLSDHLSQLRLLMARPYSQILLGENEQQPFYHTNLLSKSMRILKDKNFHEMLLAFLTQMIWINFHRRAYNVIEMEMNRLFRSEHFTFLRNDPLHLSPSEAQVLYGRNYKRSNYRRQVSPLIQELASVSRENLPILWFGERKYRGNDLRIHFLENKYNVPGCHLPLIDQTIGIIGHPKYLYTTLLNLDWETVRAHQFSYTYDPYFIIRQPRLRIPPLNEDVIRKNCTTYESYLKVEKTRLLWTEAQINNWVKRDQIINYYNAKGMTTTIWKRCSKEINDNTYGPSIPKIIEKFLRRKQMRKKK